MNTYQQKCKKFKTFLKFLKSKDIRDKELPLSAIVGVIEAHFNDTFLGIISCPSCGSRMENRAKSKWYKEYYCVKGCPVVLTKG